MKPNSQRRILNEWLDQHRGLIFKVVRAYTRNQQDSEDLFQEIAIQLWQSIPTFKGSCAETTWIYRVAFFVASKWSRREGRRRESAEEDPTAHRFLSPSQGSEDPRIAWLYEQISQLREVDRSLLLLQLEGHSYSEIGDILGLKESAVGARLTRLKQGLTQNFKEKTTHGL